MATKSHLTVGAFFLAGGTALGRRLRSLRRDFVAAVSMVSIAGLATCVYLLGQRGVWRFGWQELLVAIAAGALAEWSKYGLTGKHLTPREAAQERLRLGPAGGLGQFAAGAPIARRLVRSLRLEQHRGRGGLHAVPRDQHVSAGLGQTLEHDGGRDDRRPPLSARRPAPAGTDLGVASLGGWADDGPAGGGPRDDRRARPPPRRLRLQ